MSDWTDNFKTNDIDELIQQSEKSDIMSEFKRRWFRDEMADLLYPKNDYKDDGSPIEPAPDWEVQHTPHELSDKTPSGRERPWKKHKVSSLHVAEALDIAHDRKTAYIISKCATKLVFQVCPNGHHKKLKEAKFCRHRICPMCSWRKSLFIYSQFMQVAHKALELQENLRFIFLTLTMKNCEIEDLDLAVSQLTDSFRKLMRCKEAKPFLGYFRVIETTHNPLSNTFNPHIHAIIAVKPSYFGKRYLNQDAITYLWQRALQVDYPPICHIQTVKKKKKKGIPTVEDEIFTMDQLLADGAAEVAKYSVKVAAIVKPVSTKFDSKAMKAAKTALSKNIRQQGVILSLLAKGLRQRRLISYGGLFKKAYQALGCTDVEKSDLIREDGEKEQCECPICQSELGQAHYFWRNDGYFEGKVTQKEKE